MDIKQTRRNSPPHSEQSEPAGSVSLRRVRNDDKWRVRRGWMKVIHRRAEERRWKRKGGRERWGQDTQWSGKHHIPRGTRGKQTFSSLSCLQGCGSTCHFIVSFEIRSLKLDVVGPLPWVSTAGLKRSFIEISLMALYHSIQSSLNLSLSWGFFLSCSSISIISSLLSLTHTLMKIRLEIIGDIYIDTKREKR